MTVPIPCIDYHWLRAASLGFRSGVSVVASTAIPPRFRLAILPFRQALCSLVLTLYSLPFATRPSPLAPCSLLFALAPNTLPGHDTREQPHREPPPARAQSSSAQPLRSHPWHTDRTSTIPPYVDTAFPKFRGRRDRYGADMVPAVLTLTPFLASGPFLSLRIVLLRHRALCVPPQSC
jgi:hypothetical protein